MNFVFTAAGCHQGQPHRGVAYGYTAALSRIGNLDNTRVLYNDCRQDDHFDDPIHGSYVIGQKIDEAAVDAGVDNPILFTIGGDHTISFGTLAASLRRDPDVKLIWVDAHSDINSPETSLSGNCHGMPVSYILGLSKHNQIDPNIPYLKPENLIYIGLRSIDPAEEEILKSLETRGMLRFSAESVKEYKIEGILNILAAQFVTSDGSKPNIHISLDIDSIDPEYAPATGTPVENGLHPSDVTKLIRWANKVCVNEKAHLDITEINPDLSDLKGAATTYATVDEILDAYF